MNFKAGDKVKFVNDIGEATVKEVLSSGIVLIEDSFGFDIEMDPKELIVIDSTSQRLNNEVPSDHQIFEKDVDREKLKKAQDDFSKTYEEKTSYSSAEVFEVDLHIHELLDSTSGMNNSEMLQHQLDHFERMMKRAERTKVKKVVFIHGVGEGILKSEIRKAIDNFYPNCFYREGNPREYGNGATEVTFRN